MDWSNVDNKSALCCKLPVGEVAVPRLASTESRVSPVAVPPSPQEHKKTIIKNADASAGGITLAGPDV